MDKLFDDAKEPNEDKRKGLKGHEKLPNKPEDQRKKMLLALDETPVKTIYEKMGILYDSKRHTGDAIDEWVKQRLGAWKRNGPDHKMTHYVCPYKHEFIRETAPLGHREKDGMIAAINHNVPPEDVAPWVFRSVKKTRQLMNEIRGVERIKDNALFKDMFEEPS